MFKWNHRIINTPSLNGGDDWYQVCEVVYDKNGKPNGYSPVTQLAADTPKDLAQFVEQIVADTATRDVLHEKDFFHKSTYRLKAAARIDMQQRMAAMAVGMAELDYKALAALTDEEFNTALKTCDLDLGALTELLKGST